MKIFILCLLFSLTAFSQNKVAIIDDFSSSSSHGHLVTKAFNSYKGNLKFSPEIVELNLMNSHVSFKELIDISIDLKVKVINLSFESLGFEYNYEDYKTLKRATDAGIWVVVASGNYGQEISPKNNPVYPCLYRLENLICVGASVKNKKWTKSNHGSWVFAYADGSLEDQIGTSFSAPRVSQYIALFYENVKNKDFDKDYLISSFLENSAIIAFDKYEAQITHESKEKYLAFRGPL